jgi:Excalibur calcium-binding domain
MHSATIPLAALATFAGVYWLTPAPAGPPTAAAPLTETVTTAPASAETSGATFAAAAVKRSGARRGRATARPRGAVAATARVARPARRVAAASVYFSGCNEVRAAGLAPLFRGQPGYRREMDGDDDGIACESRRRW